MILGIGELARLFEVDPKAIRQAVEKGILTRRPDGLFDSELAQVEWENRMDAKGPALRRPKKVVQIEPQLSAPASHDPELPLNGERPAKSTDYAKARAATQVYEARLKKLRYDERAKLLVPARDVADAAFQNFRCLRDACMNVPSRMAAQLASETSTERVYQLLEAELISIFTDFSEGKIA